MLKFNCSSHEVKHADEEINIALQNLSSISEANNYPSSGNTEIKPCAKHDVIKITNKDISILDQTVLDAKEAQLLAQLKVSYSTLEYAAISSLFGVPLKLEEKYINLQIVSKDLKINKIDDIEGLKDLAEVKIYEEARAAITEDLFGDKHTIKAENLFEPIQKLFNNQALKLTKNLDETPRLVLLQGKAGIGKTTFVRYVAHQWSKGQLYAHYIWVFTLTLSKLRLLPNIKEASLSEWIRVSQFNDCDQNEFNEIWKQKIEPAIEQNQVLLILDGYDKKPEIHPFQSILKNLLACGDRYSNLSLLVTTSSSCTLDINKKRRNVEIIGFTDENIYQYIQSYFLQTPNEALLSSFISSLKKHPLIWANVHIPLNLNLLCRIMEDSIQKDQAKDFIQEFSSLSSMTCLYQLMEKNLYKLSYINHNTESLDISKLQIMKQNSFTQLYANEQLVLSAIAFHSFKAGLTIIPWQMVENVLDKEILRNNKQQKAESCSAFFKKICESGLIKSTMDMKNFSENQQCYKFLHFAFQEYYTAIYISEKLASKDLTTRTYIQKTIMKEKYNPHWQNVWWFTAGLLRENATVYRDYLQQLEGHTKGQVLTQDMLEHYQLALLVRCVDEGLQLNNQKIIESIIKNLQFAFLKLYQTIKYFTNSNIKDMENLRLIKSPFFSACRISTNLCMNERQDLYTLFPNPSESEDKKFLLSWIEISRILTPKALSTLGVFLGDVTVCCNSAKVVGYLGVSTKLKIVNTSAFITLLTNRSEWVRGNTVKVIGELGAAVTPELLSAVVKLLIDNDKWVRRFAAESLRKINSIVKIPEALNELVDALMDENAVVPAYVAESIGNLGSAATPRLLNTLLSLLVHDDWYTRKLAVEAAGNLGATATLELLDSLTNFLEEDGKMQDTLVKVIGKLGAAVTQKLLDVFAVLLTSKDGYIYRSAGKVLGKLVATAKPELLESIQLLAYENNYAVCSVTKALCKLGSAVPPKLLDAIFVLLMDNDSHVRSSAVKTVGRLGGNITQKLLDLLLVLLTDKDSHVRISTVKAAARLSIIKPELLDPLLVLLTDKDKNVSFSAIKVVKNLDAKRPELSDALLVLLADKDSNVRNSSAELVIGLKTIKSELLDVLFVLLTDKDTTVRSSAAKAVGTLGTAATPKLLDMLMELLADRKGNVRSSAVDAIASLGITKLEQLDALIVMLTDNDRNVRISAAGAVASLGNAATPKLLDALVKLLLDKDWEVSISIAKILNKLRSSAFNVTSEFLNELLHVYSIPDNNNALHVFGMRIDSMLMYMLPFWSENANHSNLFAFVCYTLGAAYLSGHISFQIYFDKEVKPTSYYMQGFIGKLPYHFLITQSQGQSLQILLPLITEQLSKTGRLDILMLKRQLPKWKEIAQSLCLNNQEGSVRENRTLTIHLPIDLESTSEQKNSLPFTPYRQGSHPPLQINTNQNDLKTNKICHII